MTEDSYVDKLRLLATGGLEAAKRNKLDQQYHPHPPGTSPPNPPDWWLGYLQALDDVESAP